MYAYVAIITACPSPVIQGVGTLLLFSLPDNPNERLSVAPDYIEWPGLKRITTIIWFQPPATCRVTNHQTRLPRATSSLALNASRDGASTASLGNLFQCVTTLWVKNFLLIANLNLPSYFKTIPPCSTSTNDSPSTTKSPLITLEMTKMT